MKTLNFSFTTKLTFDDYVKDHSFALRCRPIDSPVQKILSFEMNISPLIGTVGTLDAFGNNVTSGYISGEHRFLDFEIKGKARIDLTQSKTDFMPCYLYQSQYTKPDDELRRFYAAVSKACGEKGAYERACAFSEALSDKFIYEKGVTDTKTTAAEAFSLGKGVCQDFSHILLSLLRQDKIPCRYIAGLASCDGETHSWVEVWDKEKWLGIDPANNCPVNEDYLVLAQGRDFADCSIDRGVMFGAYTRQMQLISSKLTTAF